MLKRLIEVALPLKEVSEQSAREKSIRHGHISTLHIWWARRPLATCRAVVFASLIPDPDDPECPEHFRRLVREVLGRRNEFRPSSEENGSKVADTPRNRCLEFIKHLVRWENSNNPEYVEPAHRLIAAAHKILHPGADGDAPKVLDPFAGGGAIPLEALRLGCESHAIDLNPVAHLIELCTLVYPQKYGLPDSRPVPDYILRTIGRTKERKKGKRSPTLFDVCDEVPPLGGRIVPEIEITDAEYRKNPLAADVKYWGYWVLDRAKKEIGEHYPNEPDGSAPVAYLWARTVVCPNPTCKSIIPLIRHSLLCKQANRRVALHLIPEANTRRCAFEVVEGRQIDFDPSNGTMQQGKAACPFCQTIVDGKQLRIESKAGRMGQQLMAVVSVKAGKSGKSYRAATSADEAAYRSASIKLNEVKDRYGSKIVPDEPMTHDRPAPNSRGISAVVRYGLDTFGQLFNDRQLLVMATLSRFMKEVEAQIEQNHDREYCKAVVSYLGLAVSRLSDFNSVLCTWNYTGGRGVGHTFTRQALPMVWDYPESAPFNPQGANWQSCVQAGVETIGRLIMSESVKVARGSAIALPFESDSLDSVITDPPYYDSVPYGDLSDFFYVWLKRVLADIHPRLFRTPLTPKAQEIIAYYGEGKRTINKPPAWYEEQMSLAFSEINRVLKGQAICAVMFAHRTTAAWEAIVASLLKSGLIVTSSWPLHTERKARMVARGAAALASSVTLVCRKRSKVAGDGLWDDVRKQLQAVATERLDFFWSQGIRGADFFISAIGPALSVFGKYERVTKLSGEEVTVGQFLDDVRSIVTNYALTKILKTTQTASIDPETRFYVVWKWSYGGGKVPADEAFKLAQALGMNTAVMWDRTGILEKSGENVAAVSVEKRKKIKDLGEPGPTGLACPPKSGPVLMGIV
jgi:adenine-specific DNA methylase